MSSVAERLKKLTDQANKDFGVGAVQVLGKDSEVQMERHSSGSLSINLAIGGGWPKGRIIEVYGPESSGKTTLALHAIAELHKSDSEAIAAFIDAEHALDREYARNLGVDLERMLISQPDHGDQALEIADRLLKSGEIAMMIVDSVAALVPKAELEGEMGESKMGLQARLMGQALRKMTGTINRTRCTVFFINQLREKIGVMFGNPETTPGGKALKFYASIRVDIRTSTQLKDKEGIAVGNTRKIKIIKNKTASPFRTCEIDIMYGTGINTLKEIVTLAVELGIVKKSGSWFSYGEEKIGQGMDNVCSLMEDNPELFEEVNLKVREQLGM